jgi:hypothetical protein
MPTFHPALRPHLDAWLRLVESRLNDVDRVIQEELGFRQAPPEMIAIRTQLGRLLDEVKTGGPGAVEVDDALCPLLKTVVMYARRMRAVELEGPASAP